jgi:5-methylcytosine-specific restriction endonuclease McrA
MVSVRLMTGDCRDVLAGLRAEPDNLVLLCEACHRWVHSRANIGRVFLPLREGGAE